MVSMRAQHNISRATSHALSDMAVGEEEVFEGFDPLKHVVFSVFDVLQGAFAFVAALSVNELAHHYINSARGKWVYAGVAVGVSVLVSLIITCIKRLYIRNHKIAKQKLKQQQTQGRMDTAPDGDCSHTVHLVPNRRRQVMVPLTLS